MSDCNPNPDEFSSCEWRVGSLGPALFASIFLGSLTILGFFLSSFFEKKSAQIGARIGIFFVLTFIPLFYFLISTYVKDKDKLSDNPLKKYDETFIPKVWILVLMTVSTLLAGISYIPQLILSLQGKQIYDD